MGVSAGTGESVGDGTTVSSAVVVATETVGSGVGVAVGSGVDGSGVVGSGVGGAIVGMGTVVRGAVVDWFVTPVEADAVGDTVAVVGRAVADVAEPAVVIVGPTVAGDMVTDRVGTTVSVGAALSVVG